MTTRDHARRCARCQRVKMGTRMVGLAVEGDQGFALQVRLCTACRSHVSETLRDTIGTAA